MESEIKEKNKSNLGLIIVVIILSIVVVGLSSYVVYDRFIAKDNTNNNANNNNDNGNNNNNNNNQAKTFTTEEINKLISYVPRYLSSPADRVKDAYSGDKYNVDTIKEDVLLYMATINTNQANVSTSVLSAAVLNEIKDPKIWNASDINKTLTTMYNKNSLTVKEAISPVGFIEKDNSYYAQGIGAGAYSFGKESKIVSYNLDTNNNLIVYEKAGFYADADYPHTYVYDNSYSLYLGFDPEKDKSNAIKEFNSGAYDAAKAYISNNWDLFKTFKHTFKQNTNGAYYWYSTEVE